MKSKNTTMFFILAFTFSITCFLLAASLISAQLSYNKKYNSENNKIISFNSSKKIDVKKIEELLGNNDLTVILSKFIFEDFDKENSGYDVITKLKSNEFDLYNDILEGRNLTEEELGSNKKIGISTINKDNIILKSMKIEKIGTISTEARTIIVPQQVFYEYVDGYSFKDDNFNLILGGEKEKIDKSINDIRNYIKSIDKDGVITVGSPILSDNNLEVEFLIKATILIVLVTVLNSISISKLWVKNRTKELGIRKVCGAKNREIFKMFFKELGLLVGYSFVIANIVYLTITLIFKDRLFGIKLEFSIGIIIVSLLLAVITAFITALPAMKYISNLNLIEILRNE